MVILTDWYFFGKILNWSKDYWSENKDQDKKRRCLILNLRHLLVVYPNAEEYECQMDVRYQSISFL
jgi:hypothetical protein